MLKLFSTMTGLERGETIELGLNRYVRLHATNLDRAYTQYNSVYVPVDMTNPLVRLCYRMQWELTSNLMDWYNKADVERDELASPLGITTSMNSGEVHEGIFYGDNVKTVLIAEANPDTRNQILRSSSWRDVRPLRVLDVPGVKGAYVRPDLIEYSKGGSAVVAVDIPAIAYMLRGWIKDNLALPPEQQRRPEHFVAQYLIPSMLYSQSDAILVRSLVIGEDAYKVAQSGSPAGYALLDHTPTIIKTLHGLLEGMQTETLVWEKVLGHIPSFNKADMALNLPEIHDRESLTNEWARLAASLPLAHACAKFSNNNPEQDTLTNLWLQLDRYYTNQRVIEKVEDKEYRKMLDLAYNEFILDFA